jgi:RNA polymerase sigma factor for flagellar operon FliA
MPGAESTVSGEQLFLEQLALIERVIAFVCSFNHLAASDADDFASIVKLKFIENDYAVLRKFEGRSSIKTYFTTVIQRLFLDYRISTWGKWRPSAEAKRRGAVALLLEQLTARDGYTFDEACELLRTKHGVVADRAALEEIAAKLPDRVRRRFEADDALVEVPAQTMAPDQAAAQAEHEATAQRVADVMKALLAPIDTQDRLLLTLRFQDGRTVADIAKILHADQKALYRRLDRLLAQLRLGLEREGIDAGAIAAVLEDPAIQFEWDGVTSGETGTPRPSIAEGSRGWR